MKTTFMRFVACFLLLGFGAVLVGCVDQPTPGSRRAAQDIVDPWRLHKHQQHAPKM